MTNLNHASIKNKIKGNNEYNDRDNEEGEYIEEDNNYRNRTNIGDNEKYKYNKDNSKAYTIMIVEPLNKSYKNIFSDDLDGWDDTIEEFS